MWAIILLGCLAVAQAHVESREVYHWKLIDAVWPSDDVRSKAISESSYIPKNNVIAGIKVWKDQMFLTVPRWKAGVPVTLGVVPVNAVNEDTEPKLQAYPNWQMQEVGNCEAFQFVQSLEIDPYGRMWVLDTGRTEILTPQPKPRCPPRLVILDIEDGGKILKVHEFPEHVTPTNESYLNDVVLDSTDGGYAYISDTNKKDPGLIVYSLKEDSSWKIRHPSMEVDKEAEIITTHGGTVKADFPIDGIALSKLDDVERFVYYSPIASYQLYKLPTSVLKRNETDVDGHVQKLGRKSSQTDGMIMTADGRLFFGLLGEDAIKVWDSGSMPPDVAGGAEFVVRDRAMMVWPDTFAFDDEGNMFVTANSLGDFINDTMDTSHYNFHIVKMDVKSKSYQYHQNGTLPEKMNIPVSDTSDKPSVTDTTESSTTSRVEF